MSKRLAVLEAVKALAALAAPAAEVLGLTGDDMGLGDAPRGGRIIVRAGTPQLTETTLSPVTYWYDHEIPVELYAPDAPGLTREEALDAALTAFGVELEADRTLGGLVDWLDTSLPETDDLAAYSPDGDLLAADRVTTLTLTASYSTSGPLA
jgi:hypothetical protein